MNKIESWIQRIITIMYVSIALNILLIFTIFIIWLFGFKLVNGIQYHNLEQIPKLTATIQSYSNYKCNADSMISLIKENYYITHCEDSMYHDAKYPLFETKYKHCTLYNEYINSKEEVDSLEADVE